MSAAELSTILKPEIRTQAESAPERARAIVVRDQDQLTAANLIVLDLKALQREIDATFDPVIESAHKTHKEALAQKKRHSEPIAEALKIILRTITDYSVMIERERERKAAEDRRLEAQKRQLEADALKKVEDEEKLAQQARDRAASAPTDAARIQAETEAGIHLAAADAHLEAAAAVETQIVEDIPPLPPPSRPVVSGMHFRTDWDFEIVDPNLIPREYLAIDEVKIRKTVKALEDRTSIPGVRAFSKKTPVVRG